MKREEIPARGGDRLVLALPKGRILKEVVPLLARLGIVIQPEFDDEHSRLLRFETSVPRLDVIRVRNFDVATFVAFGAAHLGVAGNDVLMEFDYSEIYAPIDLHIGKCRMAVAGPADLVATDDPSRWSHIRVATKYPGVARKFFAARGVQAECIKLNGAMELAPIIGLSRRIVDLVQTGDTLRANGLVEIEKIADITSRLIVNRAALKTRAEEIGGWIEKIREVLPVPPDAGPRRLSIADPDFAVAFAAVARPMVDEDSAIDATVAGILREVRQRGDAALIDLTRRYDRHAVTVASLRVGQDEVTAAVAAVPPDLMAALRFAAERIRRYHERQLPAPETRWTDDLGIEMGWRWTPIDAVGLYVPGGKAAYPSSVLMNAIPARVAGVGRLVVVVPTPDGVLNPLVLAAAEFVGADEIYRVGGAQAVAALAYGTATIQPVDKIVGPGNAYVTAAKRQVFGTVGIDTIAGPSEILVIADGANDPAWIAADLLSQAEHDELARAILITDDRHFADRVAEAVEVHLGRPGRARIARASWRNFGAIIVVRDLLTEAPDLADQIAAEHVELAVADPEPLAARIRHAGGVFLGRHTPEAVGDYVGGPDHVLPTSRAARFASGLGVLDFLKRTTLLSCDAAGLGRVGPAAIALAEAEGLPAHALSVAIRLGPQR